MLVLIGGIFISCTMKEDTPMGESSLFGKLPDGREVVQYTLRNNSGSVVKIINYGAVVTSLVVPDRDGKFQDVVLGYNSLRDYENCTTYFGCIAGRYGNRIGKGKFTLDGKEVQLTINDGENHLHGGKVGFNKVLWDAQFVKDSAGPSLALTYVSPDGEEGYPGKVTLVVTYSLTDKNEFRITYKGTTDKTTILNPTHHSYFNLSGIFTNTILNHELMINADAITPVDRGLIPTGKMLDVSNTPMDFRSFTAVGKRINEPFEQIRFGKGYDHNWVLNGYNGKIQKAAELYEPQSGRLMTVYTDQPGLQFYSGNFLNGNDKGKGVAYQWRTGLCLEAQCFPDSPNKPDFPSVTLKPGEVYHQTTIYQFTIR
ncbi:MAG: galactose mutarotase [Ignavibacteriae bacterium]|nr:MAG: galactose mutarotase [Ignavibacteriota bacterium]